MKTSFYTFVSGLAPSWLTKSDSGLWTKMAAPRGSRALARRRIQDGRNEGRLCTSTAEADAKIVVALRA